MKKNFLKEIENDEIEEKSQLKSNLFNIKDKEESK